MNGFYTTDRGGNQINIWYRIINYTSIKIERIIDAGGYDILGKYSSSELQEFRERIMQKQFKNGND